MIYAHAGVIVAAILAVTPLLLFGFAGERCVAAASRQPLVLQLLLPAVLVIPYLLVCWPIHRLRLGWLALYLLLPVSVSVLLMVTAKIDPQKRGHALDFLVLLILGLAVDLRWFEAAWPHALVALNKLLLLDAGLYGFMVIRQLDGVGLDLRWRITDWKTGLRELLFYMPIAIPLGLAIGFLHLHRHVERAWLLPAIWLFTYLLIALPEEIFFRGWMQNLIERRIGRTASLTVTAILFGLSHFNKRTAHFNWRYVLLAAIAGVFYGRAWRSDRRIAASSITHACVDTLWGALLR
ncbi:CPBP family intramembrane metalloprotease [Alloacidobacterium dinghuense]|uniref:CPBP family intramembrane metalloprotease n=1 Tax=Alloacidobacterium dinghuense TaxID=2763107 RepID=A0A7G8BH22_9BACT|nr:CPBP family intramembrane glutamic endopeptidase [Alloacidobacterium dinghuense]QNI31842.1 CPBP family intramembrane metalloprotease [Alloacidobacterium dinghuense]